MKKTCYNCIHYHGCLSEQEPSQYHIHDYCDKFNTVLSHSMEAEVNNFLDEYWNTMCKAVADYHGVYNDFETGNAVCWQFKEASNVWSDEYYEKNKKYNKELAIKTLEYMFKQNTVVSVTNEDWELTLEEYLDEDEINYLKDLLNRLKEESQYD